MSDTTVESLQIKVQAPSTEAAHSIGNLTSTLEKLKNATKGLGLNGVSKQVGTLNAALSGISGANADKLNKLAQGLQTLSSCGNLKLSSSVATQITNIGTAVNSISGTNFSALAELATGLGSLSGVGKSNLNSFISQLQRLPQAVQALESVRMSGLDGKLTELVSALSQLSSMGKNNLTSFVTQLSKIPQLMQNLRSVDMGTLSTQIQQLANAFAPLANQMQAISAGFASFPNRIQRLIQNTDNLSGANTRAAKSYIHLAAKIGIAYVAMRKIGRTIGSWINKSNMNVENLNLFTVAMGEYADEAKKYAEQVSDVMGINVSDWFRAQGVFMTLATGLGVAGENASIMSKNLTQLGYDISSFFNINVEDAMQKLKSAMSGELEPVRNIGYALSQNSLQELYGAEMAAKYVDGLKNMEENLNNNVLANVALEHGIRKKISAMTEAEKVELRYIALLKQNTIVQGDLARTIDSPANAIRRLKATLEMAAISIGNIFLPALRMILPVAIAIAKVIRLVADTIASLFGYQIQDFEFGDANGFGDVTTGADEAGNAIGDATKNLKAFKNASLGIDELNIISPPDSSSGSGGSNIGGGGLGLPIPEYDFMKDVKSQVNEIVEKIKDWLGLTGDISTWAEFFHTKLGRILTTVGAIALGLAAWKISKGVLSGLQYLQTLIGLGLGKPLMISVGLSLIVGSAALLIDSIRDALQLGLTEMNFTQMIASVLGLTGGGALLGKALAKPISAMLAKLAGNSAIATSFAAPFAATLFGGGLAAIVAGIPVFITGVWDSLKNGLSLLSGLLTEFGATLTGAGAGAIGAALGAWGGPIGIGIGALIGVVVGALTNLGIYMYQNWEEIQIWAAGVKTSVQAWFSDRITDIKNFPENAKQTMMKLPQKLKEGLAKTSQWLDSLPDKIKKRFDDWGNSIGKWFDNLWQSVRDFDWSSLGKEMGEGVGKAWNFVTKKLPEIWNEIKSWFKKLFSDDIPYFFTEFIPKSWETIKEWVLTLPDKFEKIKTSIKEGFVNIGKQCLDGLLEGVSAIGDAWKKWKDGFVQGFKDALGIHSPSTVFKELGGYIVDGLLNGINDKIAECITVVKEWASSVVEWFVKGKDGKGIVESFKEIGGNIISGFKDKIGSTYNTVKTNITTWAANVKDWFTNSSFGGVNRENFAMFANNVIEGFRNKVSTTFINVKSSITTWAVNVKNWFSSSSFGGVNGSTFLSYASNIIDGFKSGVSSYYDTAKSTMTTFAFNVKRWFERPDGSSLVSSFINIGKNIIQGFIDGVSSLWDKAMNIIKDFGASIISSGKKGTEEHSPSKAFKQIGCFAIEGFNIGIRDTIGSSFKLMSEWANGITSYAPTVGFAVDTASLKYFDSASFTKSLSANVSAVSSYAVENSFSQEAVRDAVLQALNDSNLSENMRRQADKKEQTIVQVGNRTVTDAVTTQRSANGYRFVTA